MHNGQEYVNTGMGKFSERALRRRFKTGWIELG